MFQCLSWKFFYPVESFEVSVRTRNITGYMREPKCSRKYSCFDKRGCEINRNISFRSQCANWKPNSAQEWNQDQNTCHCLRLMNGSHHILQVQNTSFEHCPKSFEMNCFTKSCKWGKSIITTTVQKVIIPRDSFCWRSSALCTYLDRNHS